MSETTTLLKVAITDLVLRMVEDGVPVRDMALENPIRAIREISHDLTGRRRCGWPTAARCRRWRSRPSTTTGPPSTSTARAWARCTGRCSSCGAHAQGRRHRDHSLIDREVDWAIKQSLIERYRPSTGSRSPRPVWPSSTSAYHDIRRGRGLYYLLERAGQVERVTHDPRIFEAKNVPPQTTRAKLRGDFIRKAQDKRRDFTVDWVHLKLNDQAQRTVLCKDPFKSVDERVDKLINSM